MYQLLRHPEQLPVSFIKRKSMTKLFLLSILMLPFAAIAQNKDYQVKGKIGSIGKPAKIYLSYKNETGYVTDSVVLNNGQFEFKGTVNGAVLATLTISYTGAGYRVEQSQERRLYLEPGKIKVSSSDSLAHASVAGSKLTADFDRLESALKPGVDHEAAIMATYYQMQDDTTRMDKNFMATFHERCTRIHIEQQLIRIQFAKDNPNSYASLDALRIAGGSAPDYWVVFPVFNAFFPTVKNSPGGKQYAKDLEGIKATAVGIMAIDFTQNDTIGNPIRLSDFKGKYVLVEFWASWCAPCREENPNVVKAYNKYHDKGLEILGISLDDQRTKKAWLNAIRQDGLTWHHVSDLKGWDNEVAVLYRIHSVPANLLLDPTGKIIGRNLKGEELNKMLAEVFNEEAG